MCLWYCFDMIGHVVHEWVYVWVWVWVWVRWCLGKRRKSLLFWINFLRSTVKFNSLSLSPGYWISSPGIVYEHLARVSMKTSTCLCHLSRTSTFLWHLKQISMKSQHFLHLKQISMKSQHFVTFITHFHERVWFTLDQKNAFFSFSQIDLHKKWSGKKN